MMTQEEFMDVLAMRRQGMTIKEIAADGVSPGDDLEVGAGGRSAGAPVAVAERRVIDPGGRIGSTSCLAATATLLATSLFEIIAAEGFDGSYPTVVRWVREVRGPSRGADQAVSVPIETAPGEEAQFDFSDCSAGRARSGSVRCCGASG